MRQPVTLQKQEDSENSQRKMVGYVNSICERILDGLENGLIDCTSEIMRAKVRVVRVAVQALRAYYEYLL